MIYSCKTYFVVLYLLITSVFFPGCIMIDKMPRPDHWPPIDHFDNMNHWNGFIPVNSLQQLSEVYNTQDLILYQQKGYRPCLNVKGDWIAELCFVDTTQRDTVPIWSTINTGPYKWDKLRRISAKISNDEILLLLKFPNEVKGGNPLLGFSRYYIKIYKSKEGDLLIRKGDRFVGLTFMLFPTIWHESTWNRYEADKQ